MRRQITVSMWGAAFALVTLCGAWGPSSAAAQSFYLHTTPVIVEGTELGRVFEVPVSLTFRNRSQVAARVEGRGLEIELELDLGDEAVRVAAGVGRRMWLSDTGRWPIRMERGTWARLLGETPEGVQIALPRGLPVARAIIARGARPAPRAPTDQGVEPRLTWPDTQPLLVRAASEPVMSAWQVPVPSRVRPLRRVGRGRIVDVHLAGFVVRALLEPQLPCECILTTDGVDGRPLLSASRHRGRAVRLPAGTGLYATPSSARAFATVREPVVATELLDERRWTRCTGDGPDDCTTHPPLPTGASQWEIATPYARLLVWVRVPAETLVDARASAGPARRD